VSQLRHGSGSPVGAVDVGALLEEEGHARNHGDDDENAHHTCRERREPAHLLPA
jgi:hypothetical protein